ncbi:MAG: hypothetical protein ACOC44_17225 [Promethearchaeia archaeon]
MEKFDKSISKSKLMNQFNTIKSIKTPFKNDILQALLDGKWHSETEIVRIAKKRHRGYIGSVTVGTMTRSLNNMMRSNYLQKKFINGELYYKISDNYVGLTRAAYNKYKFSL